MTHLHDERVHFQNLSTANYEAHGAGLSASAQSFANNFSMLNAATYSMSRQLELGSPTAANCAAVLSTLIHDLFEKR